MNQLTTGQLLDAGYGKHELSALVRSGDLMRVRRGSYLRSGPGHPALSEVDEYVARVRAVLSTGYAGAIASHASAAALHRLPLRRGALSFVHLTDPTSQSGRRRSGIRLAIAQLDELDITTIDGLRATDLPRTLADLGRTEPAGWALAAADAALRSGQLERGDLLAALARLHGAPGTRRAARCLALADPRAESVGESLSRQVFVDAGLVPDELQKELITEGCHDIVDFWWGPGVVGEFDGRIKYGRRNPSGRPPEEVLWAEKQREDRLRRQGNIVVRWVWDEIVARPQVVVDRVHRAIREASG